MLTSVSHDACAQSQFNPAKIFCQHAGFVTNDMHEVHGVVVSDKSKIEWTDATWNPVRGCTAQLKVLAMLSSEG
jgi:hypothetical protein